VSVESKQPQKRSGAVRGYGASPALERRINAGYLRLLCVILKPLLRKGRGVRGGEGEARDEIRNPKSDPLRRRDSAARGNLKSEIRKEHVRGWSHCYIIGDKGSLVRSPLPLLWPLGP